MTINFMEFFVRRDMLEIIIINKNNLMLINIRKSIF